MSVYLITVLLFLLFFSQDCSLPQILHLWLDYDFYLPNSETPPSSRQTVVVEQIKAPSIYFNRLNISKNIKNVSFEGLKTNI